MNILAHVVSFIGLVITAGVAGLIPRTIMHVSASSAADRGDMASYTSSHSVGQLVAALLGALVGLYSVVWIFGMFDDEPSLVFLILLSLFLLGTSVLSDARWRPISQAIGTVLGAAAFFLIRNS